MYIAHRPLVIHRLLEAHISHRQRDAHSVQPAECITVRDEDSAQAFRGAYSAHTAREAHSAQVLEVFRVHRTLKIHIVHSMQEMQIMHRL